MALEGWSGWLKSFAIPSSVDVHGVLFEGTFETVQPDRPCGRFERWPFCDPAPAQSARRFRHAVLRSDEAGLNGKSHCRSSRPRVSRFSPAVDQSRVVPGIFGPLMTNRGSHAHAAGHLADRAAGGGPGDRCGRAGSSHRMPHSVGRSRTETLVFCRSSRDWLNGSIIAGPSSPRCLDQSRAAVLVTAI